MTFKGNPMFIQTEATPNPATLKFLPGKPVLPGSTRDFRTATEAEDSPLAQRLFGITNISGVFLGHDFVTVTRSGGEWQQLKPAILGVIMDHYLSGVPVLSDAAATAIPDTDGEFFDEGRDRQDHQGIVGLTCSSRRRPRRRRHHLQRLQGWHRLLEHEGLLRRMSIVDSHIEAWR
jgi:hypothetical protein